MRLVSTKQANISILAKIILLANSMKATKSAIN